MTKQTVSLQNLVGNVMMVVRVLVEGITGLHLSINVLFNNSLVTESGLFPNAAGWDDQWITGSSLECSVFKVSRQCLISG